MSFLLIACHSSSLLFSQSTTSFSESGASLHRPRPPTKRDIEFSEDEEGEYEEEEEEEEEEELEVKKGKVQSSVWWFVDYVVRQFVCDCGLCC